MSIVLGIDIGSSTTKIAGYRGNEEFIGALQVKADDQVTSAFGAVGRFTAEHHIALSEVSRIVVTGVGSSRIKEDIFGIPTKHEDEFASIALGGLAASGKDKAIVVSMGTGTAFVRADGRCFSHIGGTGVGGGMLAGLCQHFYGVSQFDAIKSMAEKGDISNVDLKIRDVSDRVFETLPPDTTSANFGKLSNDATKEDVVLGFINTIFETVGMMAVFACKNDTIKTVVLTGALTALPQAPSVFESLRRLTGVEFIIPENAMYSTAMGAALSCTSEE